MSFEWQTEEEVGWDDEQASQTPAPVSQRPFRRILAIFLLLLAAGAATAVWAVTQRVEEAAQSVEADVLASFNVIRSAAVSGDREIVTSFLSGRNRAWSGAVETAVDSRTLLDRAHLGLTWLPAQQPPTPTVDLSPDFTSAVVTFTETYAIDAGNGLTETVQLAQTAVYRLGPNRWLYSPPDENDYWGSDNIFHGNALTVVYPQRDAALAQRLARDLDAQLLELCGRFTELRCTPHMRVWLFLRPDVNSLARLKDATPRLIHARPTELPVLIIPDEPLRDDAFYLTVMPHLPTPSLLGLPVDEAGYRALRRGYGRWLAVAALTTLSGADNLAARSPYFQATLAEQLRQLGLQPWPLTAQDYDRFLHEPLLWDDLSLFWNLTITPAETWGPAYAFVDFVVNRQRAATVTAMQRALVQTASAAGGSFDAWRQTFLPPDDPAIAQAWLRYLADRAAPAHSPPPLPLPGQDLQLICRPLAGGGPALYRYALPHGPLQRELALPESSAALLALPDDSGVVAGSDAALVFWRDGRQTAVSPGGLPLQFTPDGQRLLVNSTSGYTLLAAADCLGGKSCTAALAAYPIWSPDGRYVLISRGAAADLSDGLSLAPLFLGGAADFRRGQSQQETLVGLASAPFWLDDRRFGFVQPDPQGGADVIWTAAVTDVRPQRLVTAADLMAAVPPAERPLTPQIDAVIPHPTHAGELLIATTAPPGERGRGHLLAYNVTTGAAAHRLTFDAELATFQRGYRLGPNGRFLLITGFTADPPRWQLYLHDLTSGETPRIPLDDAYALPAHYTLDWSASGVWLATVQHGFVRLNAPAVAAQRLVIPDGVYCEAAVFVNREQ